MFAALLCCVYGGQSLRQAVKTLEIFNHLLDGQLGRIPGYTTIETWVAAGFTECVLRLPLLSKLRKIGRINVSHVIRWMTDTRMADVEHWKRHNLRPNPLVRRKRSLTRMKQKQGTSN